MSESAERFGAYHRVSRTNGRDLEADDVITDKEAWEQIDGWAKSRGKVIADYYLDQDQSGSKFDRPELERMLADLEAGVIHGIVVAQVDRLSRADVGDALKVVKLIAGDDDENPRPLVLLDLGIDPSGEFGEFGLTILLGLARMQWRRYQRQWRAARRRAVKRGVWVAGPVPFGYRKTITGHHARTKKPVHGPLEFDEWAPVVKEAFERGARDGLHAAMAYLREAAPHKRWETVDVRRMFAGRGYLGEVTWEKMENLEAHPPLVTLEVWTAAQTEAGERAGSVDYVLSKIATCAVCGAGLTGQLSSAGRERTRRYRCSNVAGCKGGSSIDANGLEAYVRATMKSFIGDDDVRIRYEVTGLREAKEQLALAKDERNRFARNVKLIVSLGDDAATMAEEFTAAVNAAQAHFDGIAKRAKRCEQIPAADQLDNDEHLLRALRMTLPSIVVERGQRGRLPRGVNAVDVLRRRVSISIDRVPLDDLDDGVGVLAA